MKNCLVSALILTLVFAATSAFSTDVSYDELEYRSVTTADGTMPYRLFVPPEYNGANKYPIVIFLHGLGEVGNDNEKQLKNLGQGSMTFINTDNQQTYPMFYLAPQSIGGWNPSHLNQLKTAISQLRTEFNIDMDRIYLTGISLGGYGTWQFLSWDPDYFAAGVPMSYGAGTAEKLVGQSIWAFHAANDTVVKVASSDGVVRNVRNMGGSVIYTRYDSGGHGIWGTAYRSPLVLKWLMAQRKGVRNNTAPVVKLSSPTDNNSYTSGSELLKLTGTADLGGYQINSVDWTNSRYGSGSTTGIENWTIDSVELSRGEGNLINVLATGTSFSSSYGGNTTFNRCLNVNYSTSPEKVIIEVFKNVSGTIADLKANANFPDSPDVVDKWENTDARRLHYFNYGQRMYTLVVPPTTGNYQFYVAADEAAEVYLSPTTNPADKTLICSHAGSLPTRYTYDRYARQQSAPMALVAGQKYYMEVIHKQTYGDDYLSIAWTGPNIGLSTIPGDHLQLPGEDNGTTNHAPAVSAGTDQTITLPTNSVNLAGTVSDDGLPVGSTVTSQWSMVSGPAAVTFGTATAIDTTAVFATEGTYVLRLSATDSELSASDDVTITVNPKPVVDLRDPDTVVNPQNGVSYEYFEGTWDSLPDFDALAIIDSGISNNFSIASRNVNDYFGFRFQGFVEVASDGEYTFYTSSDDGSQLYIGEQLVVDNNGLHGTTEKSGTIGLKAGLHAICVTFFEKAGSEVLSVSISGPGLTKTLISDSALFYDAPVVVNQAPTADAGADQSIIMPETASLFATATDDGLPTGATLSYAWAKVSGPGSVSFSDPNSATTIADFLAAGTYVLKVTVSDSELSASDTVTVTVTPEPVEPPTATDCRILVDFGAPAQETADNWNNLASQDDALGGVIDDLLNTDADLTGISLAVTDSMSGINSSGTVDTTPLDYPINATRDSFWGSDVTFAGQLQPTAEFTLSGIAPGSLCTLTFYASRLGVNDNRETEYRVTGLTTETVCLNPSNNVDNCVSTQQVQPDENGMIKINLRKGPNNNNSYGFYYIGILQIDIETATAQNAAPSVNAGADQEVTLPASVTLAGTASDDGLPSDGVLNYFWSKVSGPGNVTFGDATSLQTTALFDVYGTYVLQLSVDDGELATTDTITVTVLPEPVAVLLDCGSVNTPGNWNNLLGNVAAIDGSIVDAVDSNGNSTGMTIAVTDAFAATNPNGTGAANTLGFPVEATQDSFWGCDQVFSGRLEPSAAITLSGLDVNRNYVLTFYASRVGVTDNRETEYKVSGVTMSTVYLDPANNIDGQVTASAVTPDANGNITVSVKKGPNNTNPNGFYYLGILKINY